MNRRDFLVEIGTEELPPVALKSLADALLEGIVQRCADAKIKHGRAVRFAACGTSVSIGPNRLSRG